MDLTAEPSGAATEARGADAETGYYVGKRVGGFPGSMAGTQSFDARYVWPKQA